jgi:hypothetical protein
MKKLWKEEIKHTLFSFAYSNSFRVLGPERTPAWMLELFNDKGELGVRGRQIELQTLCLYIRCKASRQYHK